MIFFEEATLRLKQQLGVKNDKQVADVLGFSPRAWSGRRKNNSFPVTELYALAAKRPELDLNVAYILGGPHPASAAYAVREVMQKKSSADTLTNDERELLSLFRSASLMVKADVIMTLQGTKEGGKQTTVMAIGGIAAGRSIKTKGE